MDRRTTSRGSMWARGVGAILGLSLAALAVLWWRVPQGSGALGADLTFVAHPSGELDVSPLEPFLVVTGLQPSKAQGPERWLNVRNQTGSELEVRVRATPSTRDLDRLLWLQLRTDDLELFRGPLGNLRNWTARFLALAPGETGELAVAVWLRASTASGYQGRVEDVGFEFRAQPVGG